MNEFARAAFLEAWYQADPKHGAAVDGCRWEFLSRCATFGFVTGCMVGALFAELEKLRERRVAPTFDIVESRLLEAVANWEHPIIEDFVRTASPDRLYYASTSPSTKPTRRRR